jgi:hypothetical protein
MPTPRMRVSSPRDIAVSIPLMLGYWPECSICLIVVDDSDCVEVMARWDLLDADERTPELGPLAERTHVHLVLTDAPVSVARDVVGRMLSEAALSPKNVLLVNSIANGVEWACLDSDEPNFTACSSEEIAMIARDWSLSPWAPSRAVYVSDINPRKALVASVVNALAGVESITEGTRDLAILHARDWMLHGDSIEPDRIARVLVAVADISVRDTLLWDLLHEAPLAWRWAADRLAMAVSGAPTAHAAAPATMLGILRWQCGDGSRAWAAVDRALQADSHYSLAHLVARCLSVGMHPGAWRSELATLSREDCRRSA